MLEYLIDRENEEMFRTTTRRLAFPDGCTRRVEAYRLVWTWFDRAVAYEFGPDEAEILDLALKCAAEERLPIGDALGRVLSVVVERDEAAGMDYTDDLLPLVLAKRAMTRFQERKKDRP